MDDQLTQVGEVHRAAGKNVARALHTRHKDRRLSNADVDASTSADGAAGGTLSATSIASADGAAGGTLSATSIASADGAAGGTLSAT